MIDIIVSSNCQFCDQQKEIMKEAFDYDEYRIINIESPEYQKLDDKDAIDAIPFIFVREENGHLKYAQKGMLPAIKLRRILNAEVAPYNLHTVRS